MKLWFKIIKSLILSKKERIVLKNHLLWIFPYWNIFRGIKILLFDPYKTNLKRRYEVCKEFIFYTFRDLKYSYTDYKLCKKYNNQIINGKHFNVDKTFIGHLLNHYKQ